MSTGFIHFKYGNDAAVRSLKSFHSLNGIYDYLVDKWTSLSRDSIIMKYSIGQFIGCSLTNDEEFVDMVTISEQSGSIYLEIQVEAVFGDSSSSYGLIKGYFSAMKALDPTSDFVLDCEVETKTFRRCFVAFGACINGFSSCMPVLYIDGTFLHGKHKGHLLSAIAKDGNQGLFPVAFAIVGSEDSVNWLWFLLLLKTHISDRKITFISDRHKGIISSVKSVFPDSCHSYCLYHIVLNLKDKLKLMPKRIRDRIVIKFKACAFAPTEHEFFNCMEALLKIGGKNVSDFLDNLSPENYANAFCKGKRFGYIASSAVESFNAQIMLYRDLPIMELIDRIRIKLMVQLSNRRVESSKWTSVLCPKMDKMYRENIENGRSWFFHASSEYVFEVHSMPKMVVNILDYTCSCGHWQSECFPCAHALAVITKTQESPFDFVEKYFYSTSYKACYALSIHPYSSFGRTAPIGGSPAVQPPMLKRQPGRPKKKRIPSRGELILKKIKCSKCKRVGNHNKRSCQEQHI